MAETSYPIAGGAGVNEFTYELLMAHALGTGRVEMYTGEAATVTAMVYADSTGRNVKVAANCAFLVRGYRWESGSSVLTVALAANTSGKTRIDRIVLRLDRETYTVRVAVVQGTPADAPAVPAVSTNTSSATGTYEVPIARVTVKSQSGTDLPSIAVGDVIVEHKELLPAGVYGTSAMRGSANGIGKFYFETDTGRLYLGTPSGDILVSENGPWTKVAPSSGWTSDNIYCQRVNGFTYMQLVVELASTTSAKAPSTLLGVCTLPTEFRPAANITFHAWMTPQQIAVGIINAATGAVTLNTYATTFPVGGQVVSGPLSWPSIGVKR